MKTNLYLTEESRLALAKQIAAESVVLLKNEEQLLPLEAKTVAVVGRTAYYPNLGGMGSGQSFIDKEIPAITDALKAVGIVPESILDTYYKEHFVEEPQFNPFERLIALKMQGVDLVASGIIYEVFGQYSPQQKEMAIPAEVLEESHKVTDTAVLVFGRSCGGEECDRHVPDDYELIESEKTLIEDTCRIFDKVVLIVNSNGITDLSWIKKYPSIKSVMFIGAGGEKGPAALADLLIGKETPSGKLAFTIGEKYTDYSTWEDFSWDKDHPETIKEYKDYGLSAEENGSIGFDKNPVDVYREGLFMGYRYFDTFGKEVLYPFGFGLSYADFAISNEKAELTEVDGEPTLKVTALVTNTSAKYAGKEVVQLYVSSPEGKLEQPYQSYKGCKKTSVLLPRASEEVTITVSVRDLASYDEESAAWILEKGDFLVRLGNASRNTKVIAKISVPETITCEQLTNVLGLKECNKGKIEFLSNKEATPITYAAEAKEIEEAAVLMLDPAKIEKKVPNHPETHYRNDLVKQMSDRELMAMAVGYGPGIPLAGFGNTPVPSTIQDENGKDLTTNSHPTGNNGYVSPAIERLGIPSRYYKDGPAGVGAIAWPTAMTISCAFNADLCYAFGSACGREAEEKQVGSWLAPAMNLHRNPIAGRNFEYFSEDPVVAGICGGMICLGAAETNAVTCCPKHFALNEQETYRRGSFKNNYDAVDSIVTERTARELYLKPFEMAVKMAPIRSFMTAFNKINGTFAGGSHDLNTQILRREWGFEGVVVTDWGDMDIVVDGADAVAAGNDVVMPGGPPVIAQIEKGFAEGRVSREELEVAVEHLMIFVQPE